MKKLLQPLGAVVAVAVVSATVTLGLSRLDVDVDVLPAPPVPVVERVEVDAPKEVVVGEMVRLTADGKMVQWRCFPTTEDCEVYGQKGEKYAISFREPGEYLVVFAVAHRKSLEIKSVTIRVKGRSVVPDIPDVQRLPLAQNVVVWCKEADVDKGIAASLADNFTKVAGEIHAGSLSTSDQVINRTAELNSALDLTNLEGVMSKIQSYLVSASDNGSLDSMEAHNVMWAAIADGLRTYAQSE